MDATINKRAGEESYALRGERRMIRAVIFDLDGTLVQTERLKALS